MSQSTPAPSIVGVPCGRQLPAHCQRRPGAALAAAVAVVLALSACTASTTSTLARVSAAPSTPGTTSAGADGSAALSLDQGLSIVAPAGALPAGATLAARVAKAPARAPRGLLLAGPTYDLRVSPSTAAQLILTVPVPAARTSGGAPRGALLAYFDPAKRAWVPVAATFDPVAGTLVAHTRHLSIWSVLVLDTNAALANAVQALKGFIGTTSVADQPKCARSDAAAAQNVSAVDISPRRKEI